MKKGQAKQIRGLAKAAADHATMEKYAFETTLSSSRFPESTARVDLLEVFAGSSNITVRATTKFGLTVMQPIYLLFGQDLRLREKGAGCWKR